MAVSRTLSSPSPMSFLLAFAGGFLATLTLHQLALLGLNGVGLTKASLWVMNPVPPFEVPRIISLAFWGGVFGLFYPFIQARFPNVTAFLIAGLIFGAIVPTLFSWYGVNALKGNPIGPRSGWVLPGVLIGPIVNGAWGFGTALFLVLFGRR